MQMGLIESARQRPLLVIFLVAIIGLGLFSGMLSIYEEGKYVALRPVDGSEVQGLTQTINVAIKVENIHTVVTSGDQKPYISITGLNTTYQWNITPSLSIGGAVQTILYHAEHMFPGFGFYKLTARAYYLYNANVSDVRMIEEVSTFKIVEKPIAPVIQEETTTTAPYGEEITPTEKVKENPIVALISGGLGVIVLVAGIVALYYFYIRKRYKII